MKRAAAAKGNADLFAFPLFLTLFTLMGPGEAGLYRWVDDNGVVHYTDTIPPDHVERARTEFSQQGLPINRIPRSKTAEEIRKENELERLRAQQQVLIEQLQTADRVLLRRFRTEDDLEMTRDDKIAAIEVVIQVTRNNIRRQEEWLARLRAEAANLERSGKPVPQHVEDGIRKTEVSIQEALQGIAVREEQKDSIRADFDRDRRRFRQLQDRGTTAEMLTSRTVRPVIHEILSCRDNADCDLLWNRASRFLGSLTTVEIQGGSSDDILIAAPPSRNQEINLVLSRIPDASGPGSSLFLELRCPISLRGYETCQSPEVTEIVKGFRALIPAGQGKR